MKGVPIVVGLRARLWCWWYCGRLSRDTHFTECPRAHPDLWIR